MNLSVVRCQLSVARACLSVIFKPELRYKGKDWTISSTGNLGEKNGSRKAAKAQTSILPLRLGGFARDSQFVKKLNRMQRTTTHGQRQ
jgi:hypothetical protein